MEVLLRLELKMMRQRERPLLLELKMLRQQEPPLLLELRGLLENRDEPSDRKFNLESNNF